MTAPTEMKDKLVSAVRVQGGQYAGDEERPLRAPLASAGLIGTMITAIRKVHLDNGPWNTQGGYEYNLALIAALLGLADSGPGTLSLDRALGIEKTGPVWALAALGAGALASAATLELARHHAPEEKDGPQAADDPELATVRT